MKPKEQGKNVKKFPYIPPEKQLEAGLLKERNLLDRMDYNPMELLREIDQNAKIRGVNLEEIMTRYSARKLIPRSTEHIIALIVVGCCRSVKDSIYFHDVHRPVLKKKLADVLEGRTDYRREQEAYETLCKILSAPPQDISISQRKYGC